MSLRVVCLRAAALFSQYWNLAKPYFEVEVEVVHTFNLEIGQAPIAWLQNDDLSLVTL